MTGCQPLHIAITDAGERFDERANVASVVSINRADATVSIKIVTGQQHVADPECKLTVGMPGRVPDFDFFFADGDDVSVVDLVFDLNGRHCHLQVLRLDDRQRLERVARGQRFNRVGMRRDGRLQNLLGFRQSLDVVDVGVSGDQRFATRERKVQSANDFDEVIDGLFVTNVDQDPFIGIMDQVDVAPKHFTGLEVQLDHAGKQGFSCEHIGLRKDGADGEKQSPRRTPERML